MEHFFELLLTEKEREVLIDSLYDRAVNLVLHIDSFQGREDSSVFYGPESASFDLDVVKSLLNRLLSSLSEDEISEYINEFVESEKRCRG